MSKTFFVIDTNCFVSANLIKNSTNARAFNKVLLSGRIALSDSVLNEYTEVLYREKLDKYLDETKRQHALTQIKKNAIFFSPVETITDCRDPKDNKFLELALASRASCIISGDPHLLVLHPFRGIPILNPADFLSSSF
ncbi:MAG: putative toxin-antitoxin system toxin component, PIN family [Mangrovibacterium sp.]